MWYSVVLCRGLDQLAVNAHLLDLKFETNAKTGEEVDELCVRIPPVYLASLSNHYDVAILDRSGKDYLVLDTKGNGFRLK